MTKEIFSKKQIVATATMKKMTFASIVFLFIVMQSVVRPKATVEIHRLIPKASEEVSEEMKVRIPCHLMQKMQKKYGPAY